MTLLQDSVIFTYSKLVRLRAPNCLTHNFAVENAGIVLRADGQEDRVCLG